MKFNILMLFLTILAAVALANPTTGYFGQNLVKRAPLCGSECTGTCGGCTCTGTNCSDEPFCPNGGCTGSACGSECRIQCGTCNFSYTGCTGTPPLCSSCTRV